MVELNKRYIVKSLGTNNYSKGITKVDSFIVFVDDLYQDEEALIEITNLYKNYAIGKVIEYINKSKDRIESVCDHSSDSGTCPLNNVTYDFESIIKKNIVLSNLNRVLPNKLDDIEYIKSPIVEGYRNKVTVFFSIIDNEYSFGYFKENSRDFIKVNSCVQIDNQILSIIKSLLLILKEYNIPLYDFNNNIGEVKGVSIRKSNYSNDISVMILTTIKNDVFKDISNRLVELYPNITGISLSVNKKNDTITYSGIEYQYYGDSFIEEKILDNIYKINNQSFLQVNTKGASILYSEAIKMANPKKDETILDLYCGCGGISLNIAKYSKKVIGIELSENSIHLARINAIINDIKNVKFYSLDSSKFRNIIGYKKIDTIILDPPRSGLSKEMRDELLKYKVNKIVYVSCDSYTLSRDLSFLRDIYDIKEVKAVDMFPRTKHVECVTLLSLKNTEKK